MASPAQKKSGERIIFRRIRGRIVPIKVKSDFPRAKDQRRRREAAGLITGGCALAALGGFAAGKLSRLGRLFRIGQLKAGRKAVKISKVFEPEGFRKALQRQKMFKFTRKALIAEDRRRRAFSAIKPTFLIPAFVGGVLIEEGIDRAFEDPLDKQKGLGKRVSEEAFSSIGGVSAFGVAGAVFLRTAGVRPLARAVKEAAGLIIPQIKVPKKRR